MAYDKMMKKVTPDWVQFLDDYKLTPLLKSALKEALQGYNSKDIIKYVTPNIEDIMTWAHYPLKDVRIVICGQDPYYSLDKHGKKVAHGLAFSTLDMGKIPPSLKSIYHSLKRDGLINKIPKVHNLSNWAQQGVLLLNAALTTVIGKAGAHSHVWKKFTDMLFVAISEHFAIQNIPLIYMLWGRDAQSRTKFINKIHHVLKTAHPSPMAQHSISNVDNKFVNCTHFVTANELLTGAGYDPIIWENVIQHEVYTDGSCKLTPGAIPKGFRADKNSKAAWAFYISNGPFKEHKASGMIKSKKIHMMKESKEEEYMAYPTAIRGEGVAIIKALSFIYNNKKRFTGIITLKTDSQFWHDIINSPKMNENYNHNNAKNLDIVLKLKELNTKINNNIGKLIVKHVRASHDRPKPDETDLDDLSDWVYNNKVDFLAKEALGK